MSYSKDSQRAYDNQSEPEQPDAVVYKSDALEEIAFKMDDEEKERMVIDLYHATKLMDWIARNVSIPNLLLGDFRELDKRCQSIDRQVTEIMYRGAE